MTDDKVYGDILCIFVTNYIIIINKSYDKVMILYIYIYIHVYILFPRKGLYYVFMCLPVSFV